MQRRVDKKGMLEKMGRGKRFRKCSWKREERLLTGERMDKSIIEDCGRKNRRDMERGGGRELGMRCR